MSSPRNNDSSMKQGSTLLEPSRQSSTVSNVVTFMKNLDRIQEQQTLYAKKIEKEKKRKEQLDLGLKNARQNKLLMQEKTRGGTIVKEDDLANRKMMHKMEHQIQMAKTKLSGSRTENASLKAKINESRRDKCMHLGIFNDLEDELMSKKKKLQEAHREIAVMNERKHRITMDIANVKGKMMSDIEDFSYQMERAKVNISSTQANILDSIRERLQAAGATIDHSNFFSAANKHDAVPQVTNTNNIQQEIADLLSDTDIQSMDELLTSLQTSEDLMFGMYKKNQINSKEMEQLDMENKHLESELAVQTNSLAELEAHNDEVHKDLESHIASIQKTITKYELDYSAHMEVLASISENLMNLLRNLAIDEEAQDQQLLSTGINDRNIEAFLGLAEQRIDDLIQMSKAACREQLQNDDFVQTSNYDHKVPGMHIAPLQLPSAVGDNGGGGDDDEEAVEDSFNRVQPINIRVLKDYMHRKQKGLLANKRGPAPVVSIAKPIEETPAAVDPHRETALESIRE